MRAVYSVRSKGASGGLLTGFVAANLDLILRKRGISQREFSKRIGTSESTVSEWLAGRRLPRDGHWPKILGVLSCEITDLTGNPALANTGDRDPVVRFLRKQANELGYDLRKLRTKTDD